MDDGCCRGLADAFRREFGRAPDGVWSAPGRVVLLGEHAECCGGAALSVAIDRRAFVALRLRSDNRVRVVSATTGERVEVSLAAMEPGVACDWASYPLAALCGLRRMGFPTPGVDALVSCGVPAGAGLAAGTAVSCAVAFAVSDLARLDLAPPALADAVGGVGNDVIGFLTRRTDSIPSLHGTAGSALFVDCGPPQTLSPHTPAPQTRSLPLLLDEAGLSMLLIGTGAEHIDCDQRFADRCASCAKAAATLGVPTLRDATPESLDRSREQLDAVTLRRARHVITENDRVARAVELLEAGRVADVGPLLDASHASLRDDFEASGPELDGAARAVRAAGAIGARVIGGGFAGSVLAIAPVARVAGVVTAAQKHFVTNGFRSPAVFRVRPDRGADRHLVLARPEPIHHLGGTDL